MVHFRYFKVSKVKKKLISRLLELCAISPTIIFQLTSDNTKCGVATVESQIFFFMIIGYSLFFLSKIFSLTFIKKSVKKILFRYKKIKLNQLELNEIYEGETADFTFDYVRILQLNLIAFFFFLKFPVGILIALIGNFLSYWLLKALLVHRYSKPKIVGSIKVTKAIVSRFLFLPYLFNLGSSLIGLNIVFTILQWGLLAILTIIQKIVLSSSEKNIMNLMQDMSNVQTGVNEEAVEH